MDDYARRSYGEIPVGFGRKPGIVVVDFQAAFDKRAQPVIPLDMVGELSSAIADKLPKERHVEFANESARFMLSEATR